MRHDAAGKARDAAAEGLAPVQRWYFGDVVYRLRGRARQNRSGVSWLFLRFLATGNESVGMLFQKVEERGQRLYGVGELAQRLVEVVR